MPVTRFENKSMRMCILVLNLKTIYTVDIQRRRVQPLPFVESVICIRMYPVLMNTKAMSVISPAISTLATEGVDVDVCPVDPWVTIIKLDSFEFRSAV